MMTKHSLSLATAVVVVLLVQWTSAFQTTTKTVMPTTTRTTTTLKASVMDNLYASFMGVTVTTSPSTSTSTNLWIADSDSISSTLNSGIDPVLLGGGGAAAAAALAVVVVLGGIFARKGPSSSSLESKSTTKVGIIPEPEPIDISIPYDAAAKLAFATLTGNAGDAGGDADDDFEAFNVLYKEVAVAEVTLKAKKAKLERAYPATTTTTTTTTE
jgi:hypothetical protein